MEKIEEDVKKLEEDLEKPSFLRRLAKRHKDEKDEEADKAK